MTRPAHGIALAVLVAAVVAAASAAPAHTRSQSFSTWDARGGAVVGVFQVSAVEATRLAAQDDLAPGPDGASDLGSLLRAHLAMTLALSRDGAPCAASAPPRSLAARRGALRVELRFACAPEGPLTLRSDAFFDLASSHVHTARLRIDDAPAFEWLLTDARREQTAALPAEASGGATAPEAPGAAFASYVALGVQHIAAGADHLAFLLALLLLCRRLRDVAWLVTGFTAGHSATLSLAVLGVVRPNVPVVEALIGFTIALVAAENVAVRARGGRHTLAAVAASVLLALALVRAGFGVGLPVTTSAGLALFAFAYLPLASDEAEARRARPAVTLLFGLVHGFGFASVLLEIGLPAGRLASALFGFNLGVELGQLAIVAALWAAGRTVAVRWSAAGDARASRLALDALSAALCGLGLYWFVERALGV